MLGTDFRTGSPVWLDLGSPDLDRTAAFYGAVFGWHFASARPRHRRLRLLPAGRRDGGRRAAGSPRRARTPPG
ncbi:hypothetical protein ACQ4WX_25960 [Streptomyces lasalocidi]